MNRVEKVTPVAEAAAEAAEARPTRVEAEQAVRTLLRWAREDPDRE